MSEEVEPSSDTGRLEAFSDGVFAVAITLLALEIKVPTEEQVKAAGSVFGALLHHWPTPAAFLISFLTILIMWVNHHKVFKVIHGVDGTLQLLNGLLLMVITLMPFSTAQLADYLLNEEYARGAAALYCASNLLMAIFFNLLWRYAINHDHLVNQVRHHTTISHISASYRWGVPLYLIALTLAFIYVPACLTFCALLSVFFALPERKAASLVGNSNA